MSEFVAGWPLLLFAPFAIGFALLYRFLAQQELARVVAGAEEPAEWPPVSVVIAVRDEEEAIESCVRSLLALDYPKLEVVVVNDRSTDRTAEILAGLAASDARLVLGSVDTLPHGWLGKNHALWRGTALATGERIVFTDGDVVFQPRTLRRVVRYFEQESLDHFTLLPRTIAHSWAEAATLSLFAALGLSGARVWDVSHPRRSAAVGVGAFSMVRASVYRRAGGHVPLALEVVDDIRLGEWMKGWGRTGVCVGFDEISLRWLPGVSGFIRGTEKNAFAGMFFSVPLAAVAIALPIAVFVLPWFALPFVGATWANVAVGGWLGMHLLFAGLVRRLKFPLSATLGLSLAAVILTTALANAVAKTLWRGGIVWRGRRYPLPQLRVAQRRLRGRIRSRRRRRAAAMARTRTLSSA